MNLNVKKFSANGSIPATILKQCVDLYPPFLTKSMNHTVIGILFSEDLKNYIKNYIKRRIL